MSTLVNRPVGSFSGLAVLAASPQSWTRVRECAPAYGDDGGPDMTGRPDPRRGATGTPWTGQLLALLVIGVLLAALVGIAVLSWLEHAA